MTPSAKAAELVTKFYATTFIHHWEAKEVAIFTVNQIIKALREDMPKVGKGKGYWREVLKEIDKL